MKIMLARFYEFIDRPMFAPSRLVLLALLIPLALSFWFPLWRITMTAPQYPKGLIVDIYSYKVEGGNHGQHLDEINTLNHYIGMAHIDRAALSDLDWLPFALGILLLVALRTAALGSVRSLIDLSVLTAYVLGFAFFRYAYKLYLMGHNLNPEAPMKVEPFMPVIVGKKQVANFLTEAWPHLGAYLIGAFLLGVWGVMLWHLIAGRRAASRAVKVEPPAHPGSHGARPAHP